MLVTPVLKVTLGYVVRSCLKKKDNDTPPKF
jgi:hypothetical protein